MTQARRGRLFLVPAPLDFGCREHADLQACMPSQTLQLAASLTHWICENAKSTRAYLKRIDALFKLALPLQAQCLTELPHAVHKHGDHDGKTLLQNLLAPALAGHDQGLISEAGMPAVADPGASVVRAAHALEIQVVPLVGPVSLLLALAASGMNGQNFAFVGYLPQAAGQRAERIRALEALALKTGQTQLFIETPYRNSVMLRALLENLQSQTRLAISSGLTLSHAHSYSDSVKNWRHKALLLDNATPSVFAIGR